MGILGVYLVYLLGKQIFKKESAALISAFIFSIDGLNFVQSRTGMNDIYFITFMLASLLFFLKKNFFWSAVFLGLSLSSKWAAVYLVLIYGILIIRDRQFSKIPYFILVVPIVYLLSYLPFFLLGHSWETFVQLQQQMWWYHTNLKAHHDYSSPWWSWPLNLYPVWYFVDYPAGKIGNIFASGNLVVFWSGLMAVLISVWSLIRKFSSNPLFVPVLAFFAFWLPWSISPRIMFLYHYAPSVPFLALILGYQLNSLFENRVDRKFVYVLLALMFLGFLLVYPFLTGMALPKEMVRLFFLTNITKNPF